MKAYTALPYLNLFSQKVPGFYYLIFPNHYLTESTSERMHFLSALSHRLKYQSIFGIRK